MIGLEAMTVICFRDGFQSQFEFQVAVLAQFQGDALSIPGF